MAVSFNLPDPYEAQKAEIARRQKYAEALQQQAFQPVEQFSYQGIPAPVPIAATLAKILQGAGGAYLSKKAEDEARELREGDIKKGQEFAAALQGAKTPEEREKLTLEALGGTMGQRAQAIAGPMLQMTETRAEAERRRAATAEQKEADRALRESIALGQQENARLLAGVAAAGRADTLALNRELGLARLDQQRIENERRAQADRDRAERQASTLPPNVVTTYQGAAQNERQAGSTAENMLRHVKDIEEGKLPLGAISNIESRTRNFLGMSTPESVRFADLMRDVNGAVNTILLAAKGTQTEGDARRARDQILANPNDPEVVKKALADLAKASRESQNIYRGTMNQLGGRYRGLEHERLEAVEIPSATPRAPATPPPPATPQRPAAPQAPGAAPGQQPAAPANLPRPTNRAEFDALPSGSRFVDPNGQVRVKP
jgi:hypothetical protein